MPDTDTNGWFQTHVLESLKDNKTAHLDLFAKVDSVVDKLDRREESAVLARTEMETRIRTDCVSKDRYLPVERIVYALIGLVCGGVLMAVVSLVLKGSK